jgi:GTP-binding nuclear protein Ran
VDYRDANRIQPQCAILMFDVHSRMTHSNVQAWHLELMDGREGMPIVILGNKVDLPERKVKVHRMTYLRKKNIPYWDVSVKTGFNIGEPFLHLARKLTGDDHLLFLVNDL